jgi:predicted MFS family arabinose efflux permease
LFIQYATKIKITETAGRIIAMGLCILIGEAIASFLNISEMTKRYNESIFSNLENVSRLVAAGIDTKILGTISSPTQYDSEEYLQLKDSVKSLFAQADFTGRKVYQLVVAEHAEKLYILYDLENSVGTFLPYAEYDAAATEYEVYHSGKYIYRDMLSSSGGWLYTQGPVFDKKGNVAAVIETGLDLSSVQEQIRNMVIQTMLIVASVSIAIFLIMMEYILVSHAYKKNKKMVNEGIPAFLPELLRAIIFFHFVVNNLATAILPMYALNLYVPVANLPKEFVVTLPFTAELVFAALALLVVPVFLQKLGLKLSLIIAGIMIVTSNVLCFMAANIFYLAVAYALIGLAGGTLLMILNTVIGTRKDVNEVNSGFAHFNASYLAGFNVGVILGSILAQFFPYRMVYLFALFLSLFLFSIILFSARSRLVSPMYEANYVKDKRKASFVKFIFKPIVLATLVLALFPFMVSMDFVQYFMPIFGLEQGLVESNIGQLMLLNGLFAILFGTSLCEHVSKRLSLKTIVIGALLLDIAAVYLFSLNVSITMLILVVTIIAVANIFASTNLQTYYATLYRDTRVSPTKALSLYSAVENIGMAGGTVLFSYILIGDIARGLRYFSYAVFGCLVVFALFSFIFQVKPRFRLPSAGGETAVPRGLLHRAAGLKAMQAGN